MSLELGIIPDFGIFRGLIWSSNTDDLGRTDANGRAVDTAAKDSQIGRNDNKRDCMHSLCYDQNKI